MLAKNTMKAGGKSMSLVSRVAQARTRCICAATADESHSLTMDRRFLITAFISSSATQLIAAPSSQASRYESALCSYKDSEEASDECRKAAISDASSLEYNAERKGFGTVGGVPVAVLDEVYIKKSISLMDDIESYLTLDPKDGKARFSLSKKLKTDGLAWVAQYARGGSARSQSARKLYIAVDGIVGFLASNGIGPVPKAKIQATQVAVDAARKLLAEAK